MARFTLPNRLVVMWWPFAIQPAVLAAPTAAEILLGNILIGASASEAMAEMNGWVASPSVIETPDYVSHNVSNVPGDTTIPESSIAIYMDTDDRTMYDLLVQDSVGVMGSFFAGIAVAEESNLYVSTITNRRRRFARDQGHVVDVDLALSVPVLGIIVA